MGFPRHEGHFQHSIAANGLGPPHHTDGSKRENCRLGSLPSFPSLCSPPCQRTALGSWEGDISENGSPPMFSQAAPAPPPWCVPRRTRQEADPPRPQIVSNCFPRSHCQHFCRRRPHSQLRPKGMGRRLSFLPYSQERPPGSRPDLRLRLYVSLWGFEKVVGTEDKAGSISTCK